MWKFQLPSLILYWDINLQRASSLAGPCVKSICHTKITILSLNKHFSMINNEGAMTISKYQWTAAPSSLQVPYGCPLPLRRQVNHVTSKHYYMFWRVTFTRFTALTTKESSVWSCSDKLFVAANMFSTVHRIAMNLKEHSLDFKPVPSEQPEL